MSASDTIPRPPNAPATYAWPRQPDCGDGTYLNPIIFADYSDPDVVRVGENFYLTASSFNCTPGLPILHSRDLVNWTIIAHALKNVPDPRYAEVQPGCGVWAPAIRFHAGKFWIFFPTPDEGIYVTTADDPAGQWSEPHLVEAGKGLIDPCPLWDDDGKAYLVHAYANSRAGIKNILRVRPMATDGSKLLDEGQIVFHKPELHPTAEGPKFLKKDGWYYVLAPAGGVANGWQLAMRSKNIYGPYEERIVLEQGSTTINGPHQGALVDTPNGEWWFAHFQDAGVYGRIVHLQPVRWKDGWPLMGADHDGNGVGEPVLQSRKPTVPKPSTPTAPQTSDEFTSSKLGLQWQWHANHRDNWLSLTARDGFLRLYSQPKSDSNLVRTPNLLLQKFPGRSFAVETLLAFAPKLEGEEAGLAVVGRDYAALALRRNGQDTALILRLNGSEKLITHVTNGAVGLRVEVADGGACRFSFAADSREFTPIPDTFQANEGQWIGAKVGVYSIGPADAELGHADFDYFRFAPAK